MGKFFVFYLWMDLYLILVFFFTKSGKAIIHEQNTKEINTSDTNSKLPNFMTNFLSQNNLKAKYQGKNG